MSKKISTKASAGSTAGHSAGNNYSNNMQLTGANGQVALENEEELNFYHIAVTNRYAKKSLLPFQITLLLIISFFLLGVIGHVMYS